MKMFRERLVLTNNTWGSRNVEFIYDVLFTILGLSLFILAMTDRLWDYFFLGIVLFTTAGGYIFLLKIKKEYVYILSVLGQGFFVLFLLPMDWLNPYILFSVSALSWCLVGIFRIRFSQYYPFHAIFLSLVWLVYTLFPDLSSSVGEKTGIPRWTESLPNPIETSGIFGKDSFGLLESFSIYSLALVSFAVFRRYTIWFMGALFYLIAFLHSTDPEWGERLAFTIQAGTLFFLAYLLPGRNHYAGFFTSFSLGLVALFFVSVFRFLLPVEYPFFTVIFLFFLVEGFILNFYLVSRPREKKT